MNIRQDESLRQHSTMRLGGVAAYATDVATIDELVEAVAWAQARHLPLIVIGTGSNIVWKDEGFAGLLVVNKISGFAITETPSGALVRIGAGENWDSVVARCVVAGLCGIEALSLIPGTAGATPIQNVGAYGQEIQGTLQTVEAYDCQAKRMVEIPASDCAFGYRTSRFKTADRGRFLITAIVLRLQRGNPQPPFYASLQKYLDEHKVHEYTPQVIRDAVIAIRRRNLPDPAQVANNGSFFANPIIPQKELQQLRATYGEVPHWPAGPGKVKLPAAWLLEHAGFKNFHDPATGMATWPAQPLVLVNEHAASTGSLLRFKRHIVRAVEEKFSIVLQQEPELLPLL